MEGQAYSGEFESMVIWAIIALIWLALTFMVLRALPGMRGGMRVGGYVLGVFMTATAAAPAWFFVMLMLFAMGSSGPEGPVGIGGPAIVSGIVLGIISGLVICTVANKRRPTEGRQS
ncbi:hypothetical protein SAMN05519105_0542 [Rhodobacter sp. 24-YEA-8]|nr:hypothetical protein SAMN05519105_0542 [Rhodobacter sp. 24-YEA-8]